MFDPEDASITRNIRKVFAGGLAGLDDPGVPHAEVEVYIRDANNQTFHVPSLFEGLMHLLSNEGYRLSVYEWPDGPGFNHNRVGIVVRRDGNSLSVCLEADCIEPYKPNEVVFDLKPKPLRPAAGVTVIPLEVLPVAEGVIMPPPPDDFVDVVIDGS